MKEQQCLDCGLFNLLHRATCEYCGSTNLKVIEHSLQCGKITGEIKDGVTLCGKPMYHKGEC